MIFILVISFCQDQLSKHWLRGHYRGIMCGHCLSPLADKRRDECQAIKPQVWLSFLLEFSKLTHFSHHTYHEGRLNLKLSSCGMFDFLLENMEGKFTDLFFFL